jgi:hypothetical protein
MLIYFVRELREDCIQLLRGLASTKNLLLTKFLVRLEQTILTAHQHNLNGQQCQPDDEPQAPIFGRQFGPLVLVWFLNRTTLPPPNPPVEPLAQPIKGRDERAERAIDHVRPEMMTNIKAG